MISHIRGCNGNSIVFAPGGSLTGGALEPEAARTSRGHPVGPRDRKMISHIKGCKGICTFSLPGDTWVIPGLQGRPPGPAPESYTGCARDADGIVPELPVIPFQYLCDDGRSPGPDPEDSDKKHKNKGGSKNTQCTGFFRGNSLIRSRAFGATKHKLRAAAARVVFSRVF